MRKLVIAAFAICAVILAALLITGAPLGAWIVATFEWIGRLGIRGGILFALIYVVTTAVLFPQTPFNLGAGFLFGVFWGSVLVTVASTIAAIIAFLLTRYVARDFIARKLGRYARFETMDQAIEKHGLKLVFLMRLQPVFVPFAYLNMGLGLTRVRLSDYVLGTVLGTLPGTILYAYAGSAVKNISFFALHIFPTEGTGSNWFFWIGLAAIVAFSILLAHIAKQSFAAAVKEQANATKEDPQLVAADSTTSKARDLSAA